MMFSRHGIPQMVRSDNGPQFISTEFKKFAKEWGFQHVTSSPHYPQSNGMAERHVKTAKALLTKAQLSGQDPFLMMVEAKNIPVKNGSSPAQLLTGRRFRSVLPVAPQQLRIKPINHDAFHDQQQVMKEKQVKYFNKRKRKLPSLM